MVFENWNDLKTATEEDDSQEAIWQDVYGERAAAEEKIEATNEKKGKVELTAEELKQRSEKVFADPKVKEFMEGYQKVLETGKVDEQFLKSAREIGKKCQENYDYFYFLWHKLNERGIHISADEKGVSFSRTEYLDGRDSLGHPAIPYGQNEVTLTVPLDGKPAYGTNSQWTRGFGNPLEGKKPQSINKDEAATRIFKPAPEEPRELPFVRIKK